MARLPAPLPWIGIACTLLSPLAGAAPWRSALVGEDWVPPQERSGLDFIDDTFIQDFSYAGYHRGEEPLPVLTGPIFDVRGFGADPSGATDSTAAIQAAIDAAEAAGGGVVTMGPGTYSVSVDASRNAALTIEASNVVLRGSGAGKTFLRNETYTMQGKSIVRVSARSAVTWVPGGRSTTVSKSYYGPTMTLDVGSTDLFSVGEWILVTSPATPAFISGIKMGPGDGSDGVDWTGDSNVTGPRILRQITAIDPQSKTITLDAPTRWAVLVRDGARVYPAKPHLSEIGLEGFSIGNVQHPGSGWGEEDYRTQGNAAYDAHASYAVSWQGVINGWMRDVATYNPGNASGAHILSNGISLNYCRGITLQRCTVQYGQYGGGGGNGYGIRLNAANECLVTDCEVGHLRHGLVVWRMENSGNVFFRCKDHHSKEQTSEMPAGGTSGAGSDNHGYFSHSNLYDSIQLNRSYLQAAYRGNWGSGHGMTASQVVYWNIEGVAYHPNFPQVVQSQQFGHGYVIGTRGAVYGVNTNPVRAGSEERTDPIDYIEGVGQGSDLVPASLYVYQLARRLALEGRHYPLQARSAGDTLQLSWRLPPGLACVLEESSNLSEWSALIETPPAESVSVEASGRVFYRMAAQLGAQALSAPVAEVMQGNSAVPSLAEGGFWLEPQLSDTFAPGWETTQDVWAVATWMQNGTQMSPERCKTDGQGYLVQSVMPGSPFLGGSMETLGEYPYGRLVARVRPSAVDGALHSIFTKDWDDRTTTTPGDGNHSEVDIEFLTYTFSGDSGQVHLALHFNGYVWEEDVELDFNPSKEFHDWGFDILPDRVVWHVDGKEIRTWHYTDQYRITPNYEIFFNSWTNVNWIKGPPRKQADYYIDWVKFYPYEPPVAASSVAQPDTIPGNWAYEVPPMPELDGVLAAAKHNENIYGLYVWAGEYASQRQSIKEVGWNSFRCGGPISDAAVTAFAQDGVDWVYTYTPGRVTTETQKEALFVDYPAQLHAILDKYGPGGSFFAANPAVPDHPLRAVEICNEPNFQYIIPNDSSRTAAEVEAEREALYARLLPAAYAVKQQHPEVLFVGFGAGGSSAGDLRFIQHVHEQGSSSGVAQSYDVLSTHPYVEPVAPEARSVRSWGSYSIASSLQTIRNTLAGYGRGDAPIWYTEIGWPVSKADGGYYQMSGTQVSPLLQAAYVCRLYAHAQRLGVDRVHIMFATDTDNFNAGFFTRDGSWRPSAHAVKTMIGLMPAPKLLGAVADGEDGFFAYRFASGADDGREVIMAWRVSGSEVRELPVSAARATVTDMLGESVDVGSGYGLVNVEVGPLPMYISYIPE